MSTSIRDCRLIDLPTIKDSRGSISPINNNSDIPFELRRVFYLYDIPGGESRGAHAHKVCHQFLIAGTGSFDVLASDGVDEKTFNLNRPFYGLHIPPGIWASELNFSSGSICLVLASHGYNEDDYIRDFKHFLSYKNF